eukprot:6179109-Pleurochrysis_carterae.AAC.7
MSIRPWTIARTIVEHPPSERPLSEVSSASKISSCPLMRRARLLPLRGDEAEDCSACVVYTPFRVPFAFCNLRGARRLHTPLYAGRCTEKSHAR